MVVGRDCCSPIRGGRKPPPMPPVLLGSLGLLGLLGLLGSSGLLGLLGSSGLLGLLGFFFLYVDTHPVESKEGQGEWVIGCSG